MLWVSFGLCAYEIISICEYVGLCFELCVCLIITSNDVLQLCEVKTCCWCHWVKQHRAELVSIITH
jgi:hypothetical protein